MHLHLYFFKSLTQLLLKVLITEPNVEGKGPMTLFIKMVVLLMG